MVAPAVRRPCRRCARPKTALGPEKRRYPDRFPGPGPDAFKDVDSLGPMVAKAKSDAIVRFAFRWEHPRQYKSEINRDSGWGELGKAGLSAKAKASALLPREPVVAGHVLHI